MDRKILQLKRKTRKQWKVSNHILILRRHRSGGNHSRYTLRACAMRVRTSLLHADIDEARRLSWLVQHVVDSYWKYLSTLSSASFAKCIKNILWIFPTGPLDFTTCEGNICRTLFCQLRLCDSCVTQVGYCQVPRPGRVRGVTRLGHNKGCLAG